MGHDITAIKEKSREEIAYLRIGAFNYKTSNLVYSCLGVEELNGGWSGTGETKVFTPDELKKALHKYNYFKEEDIPIDIKKEDANNEFINMLTNAITGESSEPKDDSPIIVHTSSKDIDFEYLDEFFNKIQSNENIEIYFG